MERIAYLLKYRFPCVFRAVELIGRLAVRLMYGRRIRSALRRSRIQGSVRDITAEARQLSERDIDDLHHFLTTLPQGYLKYFQPHSFERYDLGVILGSSVFLTYGVFVEGELRAYALLKVAPTGSAFIGLLVHPDMSGLNVGKFIVEYLYWQASLAGLRTCSTISRDNTASIKAHQAVSDFKIIADLPNNYMMIKFPVSPRGKPELLLP